MLRELEWLYETIRLNIAQRAEEGADVEALRAEYEGLLAADPRISELASLYERVLAAPLTASGNAEPSDWASIAAGWPQDQTELKVSLSAGELHDRVLGGWLGRSAGCLLGKPLEGIRKKDADPELGHRKYIRQLLETAGAYPLHGYVPHLTPDRHGLILPSCWPYTTSGHIAGMPRDDDIDYAILNLMILEKYGRAWKPEQAMNEWLHFLPYWEIWAAGRAAYRNYGMLGLPVERLALVGNEFRQSLGGMIRSDVWGWVNPGRLEAAASLAYRDSAMSQTHNGLYAGIFWAVAIAAAFALETPRQVILKALGLIPAHCRLTDAIVWVLQQHDAGADWEQAVGGIYDRYWGLPLNHSLPNTAIAVMGLLYSEGDFGLAIERAVMAGFDTDCTGATVGSVMGVLQGAERLPSVWTEPLQDRVTSALAQVGTVSIASLAERTARLVER